MTSLHTLLTLVFLFAPSVLGKYTEPTSASTSSIPVSTAAADLLSRIEKDPPSCVSNITDLCPPLYASAKLCWNTTQLGSRIASDNTASISPPICYCGTLLEYGCPGLCLQGKQPDDYLNWVLEMCDDGKPYANSTAFANYTAFRNSTGDSSVFFTDIGNTSGTWKQLWPDYQNTSDTAYLNLFPWKWRLQPQNGTKTNTTANGTTTFTCPSTETKLVAFAVTNIITLMSAVVLANRKFVAFISCKLGGRKGSQGWATTAILSVGLDLVASYINAIYAKREPGFHHISVGNLILLWCTRPRLAWPIYVFTLFSNGLPYVSAATSSILAEIILQVIGAYYTGLTSKFANQNGFYDVPTSLTYVPHGSDARLMYTGALWQLTAIGFAILLALLPFSRVLRILLADIKKGTQFIKRSFISIGHFFSSPHTTTRNLIIPSYFVAIALCLRIYYYPTWIFSKIVPPWARQRPELRPISAIWRSRRPREGAVAETRASEKREAMNDEETFKAMGFTSLDRFRLGALVILMSFPYMGLWMFWAGFVKLSQDFYCPPKIWHMTAIWSVFSAVAVFLSAAI